MTHEVCKGLREFREDIEHAIDVMEAFDLSIACARLVHEEGFRAVPVVETAVAFGLADLLLSYLADRAAGGPWR